MQKLDIHPSFINTGSIQRTHLNLYWITFLMVSVIPSWEIHLNPGPDENSHTSEFNMVDSIYCLSILQLNIRSIGNKIDFIMDELLYLDILCLTETHFNPDYNKSQLLDGFNFYFKDRTNFVGGVMMYAKTYLKCSERLDLNHPILKWYG